MIYSSNYSKHHTNNTSFKKLNAVKLLDDFDPLARKSAKRVLNNVFKSDAIKTFCEQNQDVTAFLSTEKTIEGVESFLGFSVKEAKGTNSFEEVKFAFQLFKSKASFENIENAFAKLIKNISSDELKLNLKLAKLQKQNQREIESIEKTSQSGMKINRYELW